MANMMNITGTGWLLGWHIHLFFGLAALAGFILFIIWAAKLKADVLKTWILWLLIIGIAGHLLTMSWGWMGWQNMMGGWNGAWGNGMMGSGMMSPAMMQHMQEEGHEDIKTWEDWREHMLEEMQEHMGL